MKLSTISKLAAVAALCLAGYVDAHAQTTINNGASVGNNSGPTGTCVGLPAVGNCSRNAYEDAVYKGFRGTEAEWVEHKDLMLTHAYDSCLAGSSLPSDIAECQAYVECAAEYWSAWTAGAGVCMKAVNPSFSGIGIGSSRLSDYEERSADAHAPSVAVAAYQKELARHAATAARLIEDNAEILSPSCLVEVETLQRSLRNAYSSTGGQLPLNEPPFNRYGAEFRGYVAALVDQSRNTSMQIADMVARNCWDPDATSFYRGEVVGPSHTEIGTRAN